MTSSSPLSPTGEMSFSRTATEPAPDSEETYEKTQSFCRQVSEPAERSEQLPFLRRGRRATKLLQRGRHAGSANLVNFLKQEARNDKNKPPWLLITAIIILNVIGKIGDAVGPAIVGSRPLELLFLNASNTHCILTTTTVSFLPWILVGVGRRFCEDPLYFYAGWKYREACLTMLRDYSPDMADGLDKAEEMFKKNLYVAVVLNPGATVCSLAGASRMSPAAFFSLNVGSTAGQLVLMRYICLQFPGRIDDVLEFISKYMMVFLALMVGITLVGALPMLRKKKTD